MSDYEVKKRYSLSMQYSFIAFGIIFFLIIAMSWVLYSTYLSYQNYYQDHVRREAQKIRLVFDEKVDFMENFLQFVGTRIGFYDDYRIDKVARNLQHHRKNFDSDVFVWNIVDFITPEGLLIADSKEGLREPIFVKEKRDWLSVAKEEPWHIKFSPPSVGVITGDYIIPVGIGISSMTNNTFIGYLGASISIEKLLSNLINIIDEQTVFLLFDKQNKQFVAVSDPTISERELKKILEKTISTYDESLRNKESLSIIELNNYISIKNFTFSFIANSQKFPYAFVVGFDSRGYYAELWNELIPKLIAYVILGAALSGLLLYLGFQVVRPIVSLSKSAEAISNGKHREIPDYDIKEFDLLSQQLKGIAKIHRNLRFKQAKLHKMNQEVTNANNFIKSNMSFLSHELINPIGTIIEFSKMLKKKVDGTKDNEAKEYTDIINKASIHQNKQLNFFLRLFRFQESNKKIEEKQINLKELVDWNISMIMHYIKQKNIKVVIDIDTSLKLLGDEIMIGQLIQNIASNGAKYNKLNGKLNVAAFITKEGNLELDFVDTGIGIDNRELNKVFQKFTRAKNSKSTKVMGYGIGLTYAKECVDLHGGKIEVESKLGKGTKFKIIFPKERVILSQQ